MSRLIILVVLIGLAIWGWHWLRSRPPALVGKRLRQIGLWTLIAVLLIAVLSGRLNPVFAALAAAVPVVVRLLNLLRFVPMLRQALGALGLGVGATAGAGRASRIRTRFLEMRLDPASGLLDGQVIEGPFAGKSLRELDLDALLRMLELYREADAQSAAVLESYLDRQHGAAWRRRAGSGGAHAGGRAGGRAAAAGAGQLSEAEARAILGVGPTADAEAIRAAHRRLMQRLHPDRGGSDYLAAQINAAKQRLLGD